MAAAGARRFRGKKSKKQPTSHVSPVVCGVVILLFSMSVLGVCSFVLIPALHKLQGPGRHPFARRIPPHFNVAIVRVCLDSFGGCTARRGQSACSPKAVPQFFFFVSGST